MTTYGYIRVSSRDQNEDRQLIAMHNYGIDDKHIILDKQSGKDFNRPGYQKLLRRLRPGDCLVFQSIDRMGRNYDDILEQWRIITREKHSDIVILDMPLLDTRVRDRDFTGTFLADLVLSILSFVAQTEREFISRRQAEGIAAAKARGVRFGRPPKARPDNYAEIKQAWQQKRLSARRAAQALGITHNTFLRWVQEDQALT